MRALVSAAVAAAIVVVPAAAKTTESLGTGIAIGLPVVAGGITLWKHDYTGTAELAVTTLLTVGTAYGLKHLVKECRPFAEPCSRGGSNWDSFPSDTSALAFAPAEFLRERYGWSYGLPAYAAAGFVGWSRVDADKHHWYDVAASFGISMVYNELITTRYHKPYGLYSDLEVDRHTVYASLNYKF